MKIRIPREYEGPITGQVADVVIDVLTDRLSHPYGEIECLARQVESLQTSFGLLMETFVGLKHLDADDVCTILCIEPVEGKPPTLEEDE